MALKLRKRAPVEFDLVPGVKLTISPIGAAERDLALAATERGVLQIVAGSKALSDYGIEAPTEGAEAEGFQGMANALKVSNALYAIELGSRHIRAWAGVEQASGRKDEATGEDEFEPAPVTRANIAELFNAWAPAPPLPPLADPPPRRSYGELFLLAVEKFGVLEPSAKNVSTSAPAINGAAEGTTAERAAPPATPAPSAET